MDVEEIVALSVKHNVSDLHLCSDSPPRWRRQALNPHRFRAGRGVVKSVAQMSSSREMVGQRAGGFCRDGGRRPAAARQCICRCAELAGATAAAALSAALLGARGHPGTVNQCVGLILVTGATGSGKSTTLAAMVDFLNHHTDGHILTLEDPVEFIYQSDVA
jgi:twitching motility protein PilT